MSQVFAAGQFYQVKLFAGRRVTPRSLASTPGEAGKKQTPQTIQKKSEHFHGKCFSGSGGEEWLSNHLIRLRKLEICF